MNPKLLRRFMRHIAAVVITLLVLATLAAAQAPTSGNVFFGYSYSNVDLSAPSRSSANGWEGTLEGRVFPHVGIVADFTGHYGNNGFVVCNPVDCAEINADFSEHDVLFGPRFSASVGKFRPFFEAEFGISHLSANGLGSHNSFATAIGGGIDYRLMRFAAWRFQGDYVATRFFSTTQNNVRLSTGIVLRF
jgi:hypothetical protein